MKHVLLSATGILTLLGCALPLCGAVNPNIFRYGTFEKDHEGWSSHSYWAGTFRRIEDPKQAYKGKACGWLIGDDTPRKGLYGRCDNSYAVRDHVAAGERLCFSVMARGTGKIQFSCNAYLAGVKDDEVVSLPHSAPAQLTSEWKEYSAVFDLTELPARRAVPVVELATPGEVFFDEVRYTVERNADRSITPELPMVTPGAAPHPALALADIMIPAEERFPDIRFRTSMPKTQARFFLMPDKGPATVLSAVTDEEGSVVLDGNKLPDLTDTGYLVAGVDGATIRIAYDVIDTKLFKAMDDLASRIKADRPVRILFLGDSLTDFDRGCNYADKFLFFLNRHHPGKFEFLNAAVRGDYITRLEDRYNGKKGVYSPHACDGIFDKTPDVIFLLLGQNDTRTSSKDGFKSPLVSPAAQEASYRRLIAEFRKRAPNARIVIPSNIRINYEYHKERARKLAAKGQQVSCFGKPENMKAFNNVSKQLCKELNLDYIDLYTPMEMRADRDTLLRPDGTHLNRKGNDFVCYLILKYFAGNPIALPQAK